MSDVRDREYGEGPWSEKGPRFVKDPPRISQVLEDVAEDRDVERGTGKQVDERASVQVRNDNFLTKRSGFGGRKGIHVEARDLAVPLFQEPGHIAVGAAKLQNALTDPDHVEHERVARVGIGLPNLIELRTRIQAASRVDHICSPGCQWQRGAISPRRGTGTVRKKNRVEEDEADTRSFDINPFGIPAGDR